MACAGKSKILIDLAVDTDVTLVTLVGCDKKDPTWGKVQKGFLVGVLST